jgi:hypothetical protein
MKCCLRREVFMAVKMSDVVFEPEDGGNAPLRNVGYHLQNDRVTTQKTTIDKCNNILQNIKK